MSSWRAWLILAYSLALSALAPVLKLASLLLPRLRQQLTGRQLAAGASHEVARRRADARRGVLYFCSSAGEYEQAKPLIERFQATGDVYQHIVFFSRSGHAYATARGETTPFSLSPLDTVFAWGTLFACVRPDLVVVVRHELWPAFVFTARRYARVYLIDAVVKSGEARHAPWRRYLRRQLYAACHRIYAVSEADAALLRKIYALPSHIVTVAGDTKYDRVVERTRARAAEAKRLAATLDAQGQRSLRLALGSAHRPDLDVVLKARARLPAETAASWQLLLAPHHIDAATLDWCEERCRRQGLTVRRFSTLDAPAPTDRPAEPVDVVLVDVMGRLAELYGAADAAFVGGAMHHQVHNVLEPASHGLALAFGPFYKNSPEAVQLVTAGLARVCIDPESVTAWWRELLANPAAGRGGMLATVQSLTGAADRIFAASTQEIAGS